VTHAPTPHDRLGPAPRRGRTDRGRTSKHAPAGLYVRRYLTQENTLATFVPYYADDTVELYHADCRDLLPELRGDLIVTDPPYEQTSLRWDRWPAGWLDAAADYTSALWCFLPRQFAMPPYRGREFSAAGWRLSQDLEPALDSAADHLTWEKHNGSSFAADRFRRVHETITHWYQGRWAATVHHVPTIAGAERPTATIGHRRAPSHTGAIRSASYSYGPTRLARSVIHLRSLHGTALHPTPKPVELLDLLIRYGSPPGGVIVDPFAGSGSLGVAARAAGRRAVLIEADEEHCQQAARWLAATRHRS
jgi:site-specific DNA-methyltransferase (adenine-specific)